jgi:uncharacterized membrane protein YvbJ
MKLVEKKCPNCGADLKFDKDDTEVTCKYCETSYEIQRDADLNDLVKNVFDANDFILHRKMIKNVSKGIIIFSCIMFIFIFVVFLIMFFNIFPRVMG